MNNQITTTGYYPGMFGNPAKYEQLRMKYEQERATRLQEAKELGDLYRKLSLQVALQYDESKYVQFNCNLTARELQLLYK